MTELVVTAGEITAYRNAVRSTLDAAVVEGASPVHAFVLAHQSFDKALGEVTPDGEQPAKVHLGQEIRLHRPLRADERVTVDVAVRGARREANGIRVALRSVIAAADGSPIAELVTAAMLVGASAPEPFGDLPASATYRGDSSRTTIVTQRIPVELPVLYAHVSGDHNPIHLDPDAARAAGFPGVIAHGISVLALVCEEAVDRFADGDPARVRGVGVRFAKPVLPDEPLEIAFQPGESVVCFSCKTPQGPALKSGWVSLDKEV